MCGTVPGIHSSPESVGTRKNPARSTPEFAHEHFEGRPGIISAAWQGRTLAEGIDGASIYGPSAIAGFGKRA